MSLNKEDIKKIASLARLSIPDEKLNETQKDLEHILSFIEQLGQADTSQVSPMCSSVSEKMNLREDKVADGNYVNLVVKNAPETTANMFVVPKVVE